MFCKKIYRLKEGEEEKRKGGKERMTKGGEGGYGGKGCEEGGW